METVTYRTGKQRSLIQCPGINQNGKEFFKEIYIYIYIYMYVYVYMYKLNHFAV